ncbi:MAG TPA: discoidin domain-containing protein, partial [Candidatus Tripitaka californicus]|uniref:discoidin domain-containing protein n=1 Tax=Candidatus Tripitaka californicus TaxID=3367616 RepID=UPI00402619EF
MTPGWGVYDKLKRYGLWGALFLVTLGGLFLLAYPCGFKGPSELDQKTPSMVQYTHRASSYLEKYPPTNLSDNDPETFWRVVRSKFRRPSWVMIDFGTDKGEVINTFQALPRGEAPSHFWRQAVLQGSNNGFFWAKLAKVYVGQPPPSSEWLTWHFDANRRYRYYRLYIKSGFFSGKRFVSFAEWRFGHTDPSMDNGIASKVQRQKGSIPNVLMTSLGRSTLGLLLAYLGVVLVALMPVFAGVASRCRGWMEDWLGDYIGRLVIKDRLAPSAGTLLIIAIVSLSLIAGYTYLFKGTHELGQRPISLAQYPHRASSCFKKEYPPNNL